MVMIGAATLKKKGYKPSDPGFLGSSLRSSFSTLDSVAGQEKKREKHWVYLHKKEWDMRKCCTGKEAWLNIIYILPQKIKGTLKQHNVTPSQSHFCEIKLST